MNRPYDSFIFEDYRFDPERKTLTLAYSLDSAMTFTEEIVFDFEFGPETPAAVLDAAFFGLFIMAGIGYYKTYIPSRIVLRKGRLTAAQARFFDKTYLHGLGQFFYENGLDPVMPASFPVDTSAEAGDAGAAVDAPAELPSLAGTIVPVGGGKDSITTSEILKASAEDFETWNTGDYPFFAGMLQRIGKTHLGTRRTLAPQLFELNREGALNGHVPITAIESFLAVCVALLRGRQTIIFSNEASANEANLEYKGQPVNHQYSKTLEFEKDFQEYVRAFVSPSLVYFSFLRPLKELRIAEIFCKKFFERYRGEFSSCNRNFRIGPPHETFFWCGECPKCAFVFLIFSPFLPKEDLLGIFGGKNLFADPALRTTFEGLFGTSGPKPLECVGEISEARQAAVLARATGDWPELAAFEFPEPPMDYTALAPHVMPERFAAMLTDFIKANL